MRHICLVGAGYIAQIHAEAIRTIPGLKIAAIVDPNSDAARRLAVRFGVTRIYESARDALDSGGLDAAHILVPPNLHAAAALPFLSSGKPVLLEKPMAVNEGECAALRDAAAQSVVALGVNQNFVHHPSFVKARSRIAAGEFGPPRFVECRYNVPLAQLSARQFGHWMFHEPVNILLEQAVHPLSQIAAIAGTIREIRAIADPPINIAPGRRFYPATTITLSCDRLPAQLRFALGQSFPFWQLSVICDDAVVVADILANRVYAHKRTRWLDAVDNVVSGAATGLSIGFSSWRNAWSYGLSTLGLKERSDPFFISMRNSIAAFHRSLDGGERFETDGAFGAMLIDACTTIRNQAFSSTVATPTSPMNHAASASAPDIAVLGGTGFIGTETVRRLVAAEHRVSVLARSVRNLPEIFHHPQVTLHQGDIRDLTAVGRAVAGAQTVVNLAHGGGGENFDEVRDAMVGGAETIAQACIAASVNRLVYVGSIASLYLGSDAGVVTGAALADPRSAERADYARAKALAEGALLGLHDQVGFPVVILRPGLVVGEGTSPLHAGLGFCNNMQHVIGWNEGRNPLPFVLVSDVAEAILRACLKGPEINGRCYNLVGDVRPNARQYVAYVAELLQRPLRFHAQSATRLWLADVGKWIVKRIGGRRAPLPSRHDLISRGCKATFDCGDAKRELEWEPVADQSEFFRQAVPIREHTRHQTP